MANIIANLDRFYSKKSENYFFKGKDKEGNEYLIFLPKGIPVSDAQKLYLATADNSVTSAPQGLTDSQVSESLKEQSKALVYRPAQKKS